MSSNHAYAICEPAPSPDHAHREPDAPRSPREVLARVAHHERPDWAAHSVLRRTLEHPERPDVVHARTQEVTQLLSHTPPGPERDALDAYRDRLHELAPSPEPPTPEGPSAPDRELGLDLGL